MEKNHRIDWKWAMEFLAYQYSLGLDLFIKECQIISRGHCFCAYHWVFLSLGRSLSLRALEPVPIGPRPPGYIPPGPQILVSASPSSEEAAWCRCRVSHNPILIVRKRSLEIFNCPRKIEQKQLHWDGISQCLKTEPAHWSLRTGWDTGKPWFPRCTN